MRKYPHKPVEKALLALREVLQESLRSKAPKAATAAAARNAAFFEGWRSDAAELADLAYAFEEPIGEIRRLLSESCAHASKAAEFGVVMNPTLYMAYIALSGLCGDEALAGRLRVFQRRQFTNPNIRADEIFYLCAEAHRGLSAGHVEEARKAVAAGTARARAGDIDSDAKSVIMPLLAIEQAIIAKGDEQLAAAVTARHEEHRQSYTPREARSMPSGLLDLVGLGLLKIAANRGLHPPASSVYLPIELL